MYFNVYDVRDLRSLPTAEMLNIRVVAVGVVGHADFMSIVDLLLNDKNVETVMTCSF